MFNGKFEGVTRLFMGVNRVFTHRTAPVQPPIDPVSAPDSATRHSAMTRKRRKRRRHHPARPKRRRRRGRGRRKRREILVLRLLLH